MKENEISAIIGKFAKVMGPVAERIATDAAKELGILKGEKISPSNAKEYQSFLDRIEKNYSKIIGKEVTKTIMKL
jgi:predicted Ser/Thr protein kinase